MAKTIPQFKIDPEAIHSARRKLQRLGKDGTIEFDREEREALLTLIGETKRDLYPTQMGLDRYTHYLDQIENIDPGSNPEQFEIFAGKIQEFEEKFCK